MFDFWKSDLRPTCKFFRNFDLNGRTPPSYLFLCCPRSVTPLPPYSSVDHPLTTTTTISTPPPYTAITVHCYEFCEGCQLSISGSSTWINEKNSHTHIHLQLDFGLCIYVFISVYMCVFPLSQKYISWMSY